MYEETPTDYTEESIFEPPKPHILNKTRSLSELKNSLEKLGYKPRFTKWGELEVSRINLDAESDFSHETFLYNHQGLLVSIKKEPDQYTIDNIMEGNPVAEETTYKYDKYGRLISYKTVMSFKGTQERLLINGVVYRYLAGGKFTRSTLLPQWLDSNQ